MKTRITLTGKLTRSIDFGRLRATRSCKVRDFYNVNRDMSQFGVSSEAGGTNRLPSARGCGLMVEVVGVELVVNDGIPSLAPCERASTAQLPRQSR